MGNSSLYRVHWTDGHLNGTLNGTETYVNITDLTAGVQYEISVTAVADDGHTGGQSVTVVRYTSKLHYEPLAEDTWWRRLCSDHKQDKRDSSP